MPQEFITKRPHRKSRAGCKTCKTRKVKCDEVRPKCGFCLKRDLDCHFEPIVKRSSVSTQSQPHSPASDSSFGASELYYDQNATSLCIFQSPTPPISTELGILTQSNLRAMHFWDNFTSETLLPARFSSLDVFKITVPQLAFENDFLLNVMLGISSLHMQTVLPYPDDARKATDIYRAKAFNGFREALSRLDPDKIPTWEAALVTGILLTLLCAKDYLTEDGSLTSVQWLNLYRGLASVITLRTFAEVMTSRVAPIFRRELNSLEVRGAVPLSLSRMIEDIQPHEPDYEYIAEYRDTLNLLGVLYASLYQDGPSISFQTRVISWPSFILGPFVVCAKEGRSRALVLLAHYMCFVKCMPSCWWVEGVADRDIQQIFKMVPPKWFSLLELPRRISELTNINEMVGAMLQSVDERYSSVAEASTAEYNVKVRWFTHKNPAITVDPDVEEAKMLAKLRLSMGRIEEI